MWYDCLAVAILAYTTIRGAMKGVIWQIAAIAGLVLCFVFSESISAAAGPYVHLEPPLNNWVVMAGAYLLFSFGAFAIARLLTEWLDRIHFGDFNRHLGAIFGFVKGVLIVLVLTFFSVTVSENMHQVLQHSRTGPIAAQIVYHLHPVMPEKLQDALARYINIHKLDDPELQRKYEERRSRTDEEHRALAEEESELILPSEFEEVLAKMPKEQQGEFRALLMRSFNRTESKEQQVDLLDSLINAFKKVQSSDDLTSLMDQLRRPSNDLVADVRTWLRGGASSPAVTSAQSRLPPLNSVDPIAPMESEPAPQVAAVTPSRRDQLVQEISAEFSRFPLAQQRIREDIERQLAGVPEAVAVSALEDWRADLVAARPGQAPESIRDPDPSTKAATTLRSRIERQTARGVSLPSATERLQ